METATYDREALIDIGHPPLVVQLHPVIELSDDQFFDFCQANRDLRIERSAREEVLLMPPTGGDTSELNAEITMQLRLWAKRDGSGTTFDSSGGFLLPNSAVRSPDAAWLKKERLAELSAEQKMKFIPLCPDFVIELCSPSDSLNALQDKMREYIDNGVQLGWLVDPAYKRVYIYRPQTPVEELQNPETVSDDPLLPGFALNLRGTC